MATPPRRRQIEVTTFNDPVPIFVEGGWDHDDPTLLLNILTSPADESPVADAETLTEAWARHDREFLRTPAPAASAADALVPAPGPRLVLLPDE